MKNLRIHIAYLFMFFILGSLAFAQTVDVRVSGRVRVGGTNDGSTTLLVNKEGDLTYTIVDGNLVIENCFYPELIEKNYLFLWGGKYDRFIKVNDSTFVLLKKEESFSKRLGRLTKK